MEKTYKSDSLEIVWKAHLCAHSGNCLRGLSKVFNLKEKPWINLEDETDEKIKNQVDKCPSGALSYQNRQ